MNIGTDYPQRTMLLRVAGRSARVAFSCLLGGLILQSSPFAARPAIAQDSPLIDPALEGDELAEPSNPERDVKRMRPFEAESELEEGNEGATKFNGTFTFACTPDLPGKMSLNIDTKKGITPLRLFAIIDDRTLSFPLHKIEEGVYEATFPSPWKRFEYMLQFSTGENKVFLSNRIGAKMTCRSTTQLARILEKTKSNPAREKLLKDAVMLDDDIRRIEFVARKLRELSLEVHRPSAQ